MEYKWKTFRTYLHKNCFLIFIGVLKLSHVIKHIFWVFLLIHNWIFLLTCIRCANDYAAVWSFSRDLVLCEQRFYLPFYYECFLPHLAYEVVIWGAKTASAGMFFFRRRKLFSFSSIWKRMTLKGVFTNIIIFLLFHVNTS